MHANQWLLAVLLLAVLIAHPSLLTFGMNEYLIVYLLWVIEY